MSVAEHLLNPPALLDVVRPYRLTGDQVRAMVETGVLPPDLRFELVEGQIVEISPISNRHNAFVLEMIHQATGALPKGYVAASGVSLQVDAHTELIPDLLIVKHSGEFRNRPLRGKDALLVVEVSHSTRKYDAVAKAIFYASAGVQEYMVVDIEARELIVHRDPKDFGYSTITRHQRGRISPLALPKISFDLKKLFG